MTAAYRQEIPYAFDACKEKILASAREYIRIHPQPKTKELLPWESKFLGQPYLPKGYSYPQDAEGKPLHFLAQINFSDVPRLVPFPEKGILQFYVAKDELFGLELPEPSDDTNKRLQLQTTAKNFRVLYFPEILENIDALQMETDHEYEFSPIETESSLRFTIEKEYVPTSDKSFEKLIGDEIFTKNGVSSDELWDAYTESIDSSGCKIGGYAFFMQGDVREIVPEDEEWLLLLQLDYTEEVDIMWGDSGAGNFFIEKKALENLDFSQVLYNWDCA
jgi:uncharacterized protein YwqG